MCVIDSGADISHPDLKVSRGYNVLEDAAPNNFTDGNGHGTHVAGILSAINNNGKGVAGVAWQVREGLGPGK